MRPSRLLLLLASALTGLSLVLVAATELAPRIVHLAWAALAIVALTDILLSRPVRRIAVASPPSREIFAGEAAELDFPLEGMLPAGAHPQARLALPEGLGFDGAAGATGETAAPHFTVRGERRGVFALGPLSLLWRSRLRLFDFVRDHPVTTQLRVVPSIRAVASGEVRHHLAAHGAGAQSGTVRGEGAEFHQLREFVAGMDARTVDWKRSARHRSLVAREMRIQTNHSVVLALDNGHLMRETVEGVAKIDHMVSAALALAFACLQSGDLVGLYAFDARPRLFVPPDRGRTTFATLRSRVAELDYRQVESNPTLALSQLQASLKRRSLVVLFTDFVDTTTAELMVENVAVMRRHHVVVLVTAKDPVMAHYGGRPALTLGDVAETVAASDLSAERARVLHRLRRRGIIVVEAPPGRLVAPLLDAYLAVKGRGLL